LTQGPVWEDGPIMVDAVVRLAVSFFSNQSGILVT
jgi:hypothetical protein